MEYVYHGADLARWTLPLGLNVFFVPFIAYIMQQIEIATVQSFMTVDYQNLYVDPFNWNETKQIIIVIGSIS